MKKLLILLCILTSLPAFAACPIDGDVTSCSLAQFRQVPMNQTYAPKSGIKEFASTPEARLKPRENNIQPRQLRNFGPTDDDYNYNSSCQFGVCNDTGAPQTFQKD